MVLLGAIAARTTRVRIGPACFASTPLRNALLLAYQWASLDLLSDGRTIFVACQGQAEPGGGAFEREFAHFGIEPRAGCVVWRKRSRYCASPPRARI